MTITPELLRTIPLKRWNCRLLLDGLEYIIAEGLVTRSLSQLRGRSTAVATLRNIPPATGGQFAQVRLELEGYGSIPFFVGKTDQRSAQSARMNRQANLVDFLDLDRAVGEAITWDNVTFVDAVAQLLALAGWYGTASNIYDPGIAYVLGPEYPVVIEPSESLAQVWADLMAFGGTAAVVEPSGIVRVINAPGIPMDTSATIYARGHEDGEFGIEDAGYSIEGVEGIVSTFTATGPKRPDGAIPDGTFTATGFIGREESQEYRFLQTDPSAQVIARRELGRRVRQRTSVWFQAPLNPFLIPGDTVLFRDYAIGLPNNTPAIVLEVATDATGGMRVQLSIGPSLIDGYQSSIGPPVVDFGMIVEVESIVLDGVLTEGAIVQCQDLSRDPAGEAIVGLTWTATGATPETSTDPNPIFVFPTLVGAEINLTALSATGESASVTLAPSAPEVTSITRVLSVAAGSDGWRVLVGAEGWRSYTRGGATCTTVPTINPDGPLLAGWSDGVITITNDNLLTVQTLTTLAGSIGALWINEATPTNILAGHGSRLSRSVNGGTTWTELTGSATFGDDVTDCQSSPANPNEIRVTADNVLWLSFDGGVTFAPAVTGPEGTTAEALATAPWGRAAVFSGVASVGDAIAFEEGHVTNWADADPQPASGLTAITPLLDQQGYLVGDNPGLIRDGLLSALAYSAGAGDAWRLLWDGAQFQAAYLLPTTDANPGKFVLDEAGATHYPIDEDISALAIGYGSLSEPVAGAEVLLITNGATPGGVWHWTQRAGWVLKNTGLPSGWTWLNVTYNRLNPDDWLLLGSSGGTYTVSGGTVTSAGQPVLYRTLDAGATWTGVALAGLAGTADRFNDTTVPYLRIGYTSQQQTFVSARIAASRHAVWRDGVPTEFQVGTSTNQNSFSAAAGQGGDVIILLRSNATTLQAVYLAAGSSSATAIATASVISLMTPINTRRLTAGRASPGIVGIGDYRSAGTPTAAVRGFDLFGGGSPDGTAFVPAATGGAIYRVNPHTSDDTLVHTMTTGSGDVFAVYRDMVIGSYIAAVRGLGGSAVTVATSVDGGATWDEFAGPSGLIASQTTANIAVINREDI